MTAVCPGVVDLLDRLGGARLAVVTSKPRPAALAMLEAAGLGVDAGGTVMIGDRRHDSEAGRVHGTGTIGVLWGFGDADELEAAGPDRVVAAPAELGTALLGSA